MAASQTSNRLVLVTFVAAASIKQITQAAYLPSHWSATPIQAAANLPY